MTVEKRDSSPTRSIVSSKLSFLTLKRSCGQPVPEFNELFKFSLQRSKEEGNSLAKLIYIASLNSEDLMTNLSATLSRKDISLASLMALACSLENNSTNNKTGELKIEEEEAQNNENDEKSKTVYVGNLPSTILKADLVNRFVKIGPLIGVKIFDRFGYGFVTFETAQQAQRAIKELNQVVIKGRSVIVKPAQGRSVSPNMEDYTEDDSKSDQFQDRKAYRLDIENLPHRLHWRDLKDYFGNVATVYYANININIPEEGEDVQKAKRLMEDVELQGRKLQVKETSHRRRDSSDSSDQ